MSASIAAASLGCGQDQELEGQTSDVDALATVSGWDYDLTKKCARTVSPGRANSYRVDDQCTGNGKRWTLAVQSENTFGASCPGPTNQSYPINAAGSPVSLRWLRHRSPLGRNWSVNLKVDGSKRALGCPSPQYTWFAFMDHAGHEGGPLPKPNQIVSSHHLNYGTHAPTSQDGSRLIFGAQFFWGGKARQIEVFGNKKNWADADPDPCVIARFDFPNLEYLQLEGSCFGLNVPKRREVTRYANWRGIVKTAVDRGWLSGGRSSAAEGVTQAVFVAVEVRDDAIADLWHTNFRVAEDQPLF